MADAAAQKREARRRRILENSENRLKRITGLYSSDGNKESPTENLGESGAPKKLSSISPVSYIEGYTKEPGVVTNVESYLQSSPSPECIPDTIETLSKPKSSHFESPSTSIGLASSSQTKPSLVFNICQKVRVHIIILAVIVKILLTLPCAVLFGESALVPLYTIELAEWIYTKVCKEDLENSPSGLLGMAMMLSGIAPQKVVYLQNILNFLNQIFQDFCIYFFVFSLTHAVLQVFSYS